MVVIAAVYLVGLPLRPRVRFISLIFCFVFFWTRFCHLFPVFRGIADAIRRVRKKRWRSVGVRRDIRGDADHLELPMHGGQHEYVPHSVTFGRVGTHW